LKKSTFILFLFVSCFLVSQENAVAQDLKKRDSLENYLKKATTDSSRASTLALLSNE